jgi:hypothetical protein
MERASKPAALMPVCCLGKEAIDNDTPSFFLQIPGTSK